ncbi:MULTISPECIES: cytochrome c oxidase subunit CcoM [Halomonadaceae]|nr:MULTISPECIES: cytochrome c oxidase subunit CcoM [Halomonas]
MYWDTAVIFGLVTVGLMLAFMGGWIGFVMLDHKRHGERQD